MSVTAFYILLSISSIVLAANSPNVDVPQAYQVVASEYALPPVLLYSVALTESNDPSTTAFLPWPWTVNHDGKGLFFSTRLEAYRYLSQVLESGQKNFDVGLMQVNWRWNAGVFTSLWDALDPYTNLRGGASIMRGHYHRLGSYEEAVGAYHSPSNRIRAEAYRERVRANLAVLQSRSRRF